MQAEKLKAMTQRACCQREVLMQKRQRDRGDRERSRERGVGRERGSWRVKRQRSGKLPSVYCLDVGAAVLVLFALERRRANRPSAISMQSSRVAQGSQVPVLLSQRYREKSSGRS